MANQFGSEIEAWKKLTLERVDNKCREIVQDLFNKVVDETPVNKMINEPKRGQLVAGWNKDVYITFTNSVEYVMKAERLGWANTGPYMMVAKGLSYITAKYGA